MMPFGLCFDEVSLFCILLTNMFQLFPDLIKTHNMPSMVLLKNIRLAAIKDATQDERNAWFIYGSKLIPVIAPGWKRNKGQCSTCMSDLVTCSDEAFILWVIQVRFHKWESVALRGEEVLPSQVRASRGPHYFTTDMSSFNALHHHIRNIRANIFNHGWELDLQNQFVEITKARLADHTNSTISDDQSDNDNHAGNADADIPIDDSDDEWLL
jgi:hypothetical protein